MPSLTEIRELNTTMVATTRILANRDHLIRHFFMNSRIQGEYAIKAGTPQPKVEITPTHTRPPWLFDKNETIDLTMCAIPKRASKERIKTDFTFLMADKYEEYDQIYTDGSLKDGKVRFDIVTNKPIIKKKDEIPIFNIQCRTASDHNGYGKYNTNK
jgi:hypothetical protein